MFLIRQCVSLAAGVLFFPAMLSAQNAESNHEGDFLPDPVVEESFADLKESSPFLRTLNLSQSLILTGYSKIDEEGIATVLDLDTKMSYVVSQKEINSAGWQLVEVKGDQSDLKNLTARIKVGNSAEVVSIRYEKTPMRVNGVRGIMVSTKIGNGTPGGGTGPHGGPDPRVLTPDQLSDARNAARNIRDGFQADGYADKQTIPPEVVSKISRLSVKQRESINVKMFEYRNRGLGMPERQKIYNRLLDRELGR